MYMNTAIKALVIFLLISANMFLLFPEAYGVIQAKIDIGYENYMTDSGHWELD